jgi:hypothetical protein
MFSLNTSARMNIKDPPMEPNFINPSSLSNIYYKSMLVCPAARDDTTSTSAQHLNVHIRDPQSGNYLNLSHFL